MIIKISLHFVKLVLNKVKDLPIFKAGDSVSHPQHGEGTSKAASISCVHTVLGHQELVDPVSVGANASMDPATPPRTTDCARLSG